MKARRLSILLTCVMVAILAVVFAVLSWDRANRLATVTAALAGVAAVGIAVWAALRTSAGAEVRVTRTGPATATGAGSTAVSGVTGDPDGPTSVDRTGAARAADGGDATSGVRAE